MPYGHLHGQRILGGMQTIGYARIPALAADAGHQCGISLQSAQALYLIVGCLTEQHNATQGIAQVTVAGCFAAPGRSEHGSHAILAYTYHGVIVVNQLGALDIPQPQSGMRTLTCAAGARNIYPLP